MSRNCTATKMKGDRSSECIDRCSWYAEASVALPKDLMPLLRPWPSKFKVVIPVRHLKIVILLNKFVSTL